MEFLYNFICKLNMILTIIPFIVFYLIKINVDIYSLRNFIGQYTYIVIIYLTISAIISIFFFKKIRPSKVLLLLSVTFAGILIYMCMYDKLIPY